MKLGLFGRKTPQNVFTGFLEKLRVNYTESFSDKYFNEHPHKYNLYGLSKMLSGYGIRNAATKIEDKENDLFNIECPFVAHSGGDFVVVYKSPTPALPKGVGDPLQKSSSYFFPFGGKSRRGRGLGELEGAVHFLRNGKKLSVSVSEFIQSWSGVILLAETAADSIEPDYAEHRKKELLYLAQQAIIAVAGILILGIAYINNIFGFPLGEFNSSLPDSPYSVLRITTLLAVNLIGIYICYLLVLKQLRIHSRYADKLCTLFSKSDCNNVLESDAAKLWGVFGWSEIGLGYFAANVFILLFLPQLTIYSVVFNILALPYTVWSVWYQKVKARQWCPLCLIVLVLLWGVFLLNGTFGYIQLPDFYIQDILLSGSVYAVFVFSINLLVPKLSEGNQVDQLRHEINSIKANEEVFKTLLTQQPSYEVSASDSNILFSPSPSGRDGVGLTLTILTNPFCNPCAKMHERVEKLLKETNKNVCIQYIFSAFNESLEYANRYFTAIYLEKGSDAAWQLYSDWFKSGKSLKEAFFNDLKLDMSNPAIEVEFQKHESWKAKTQLRTTPTIIVNGYKLPDNYKIEDLRYFTEFNVDVK